MKRKMQFPHPSVIVRQEYLPANYGAFEFLEFINGERNVDSDMAKVLAKMFNTTEQYWLNMQKGFDDNNRHMDDI